MTDRNRWVLPGVTLRMSFNKPRHLWLPLCKSLNILPIRDIRSVAWTRKCSISSMAAVVSVDCTTSAARAQVDPPFYTDLSVEYYRLLDQREQHYVPSRDSALRADRSADESCVTTSVSATSDVNRACGQCVRTALTSQPYRSMTKKPTSSTTATLSTYTGVLPQLIYAGSARFVNSEYVIGVHDCAHTVDTHSTTNCVYMRTPETRDRALHACVYAVLHVQRLVISRFNLDGKLGARFCVRRPAREHNRGWSLCMSAMFPFR
jgi:hypothetical protein